MDEKLVMLPWDFIHLKCGFTHTAPSGKLYNPEMEIKEGMEGAYYDCPEEHCTNRIPPLVYEYLLQESMALINEGLAKRGYCWKKKVARQYYEFEIYNYKPGEKISIGIRNLSVRKRG